MDLSSLSGLQGNPSEKKQAIKAQVSSELAMANAQQLITKATEKCYSKCIPAPASCLTRCMERYFEAFNVVSSTYVTRVGNERAAGVAL